MRLRMIAQFLHAPVNCKRIHHCEEIGMRERNGWHGFTHFELVA